MNIATIEVSGTYARIGRYVTIPAGIVGATVDFRFTDDLWAGLQKTVVFRSSVTRDVLLDGTVAVIPHETVAKPGDTLYVGVYGVDAENNLVIPTLWTGVGGVRDAADPSGDPGTDPSLPVWADLQNRVENLEERPTGSGIDVSGAAPGQTVKIAAVDDNGRPTSWEPADFPESGGNVDQMEPMEEDIPKVFIAGVRPTTKDDALAEMKYVSKTDRFHAYLTINCQGSSSMSYPKKNFTIKMFSDEARETKLNKSFKDWNHNGNKYVLKANYIDHSHARNIVSARLWNEVVKSRLDYDSLPEEMRKSPRNGAVDGFPIKVYYNGTYEGVYTWNIGKEDWQWGMDEDNTNHVLLCAETNTDGNKTATPCNFRALWNGVHGTHWSVEVGTNSTAVKNSLNNLIQFVMENDGDDFRNGIGNYLDIQSAIDYYIFQYEVCGLDGLAKNMLLATYDGTKWICGAYDLDSTFGLWWDGNSFVASTYACPEDYQENYSLLWERIEANFLPELKARQAELRKTVLSYSNMVAHFERFMDIIGLDLYAEDLTIYTAIPSGSTNNIKQIRDYIRDRQSYVDAEFADMSDLSGDISDIRVTLSEEKLTIAETDEPAVLTASVEPTDTEDELIWSTSNLLVASVADGVVSPVFPGTCTITAKAGTASDVCVVTVEAEPLSEYEWSKDASHDIDAITGAVKNGDKHLSTVFNVRPGRYIINNGNNAKTWYNYVLYDNDGVVVRTCGQRGDNSIAANGSITFYVHEDMPGTKVQIAVYANEDNGISLDNISIERGSEIFADPTALGINDNTGVVGVYDGDEGPATTMRRIQVEGGKTYRITAVGVEPWTKVYQYAEDGIFLKYAQPGSTESSCTITMESETAFVHLTIYNYTRSVDVIVEKID